MAKRGMPMGGINPNMMKQVQKMQQDMMRTQAELEERTYTGTSGGGAVEAVVTGKRQLQALTLKEEVVDPEDIEMLQDLILTAVNAALTEAEEAMSSEMGKFTGGLNLPF